MANTTPRDDLHAPPFFKTFTSFASAVDLADQCPNGDHLPCQVFVDADAAEVFEMTDALGNTATITFTAAWAGVIRCAPKTLTTNNTVSGVTAFWHPEP